MNGTCLKEGRGISKHDDDAVVFAHWFTRNRFDIHLPCWDDPPHVIVTMLMTKLMISADVQCVGEVLS